MERRIDRPKREETRREERGGKGQERKAKGDELERSRRRTQKRRVGGWEVKRHKESNLVEWYIYKGV